MKFDREAPGGGVEIYCDLQMGKAILEWKFYCTEPRQGMFIKLYVWDREGNLVLEAGQLSEEDELLKTILLHPHLWNGTKAPYLYRGEAVLLETVSAQAGATGLTEGPSETVFQTKTERILDTISFKFPIRSFREVPGKGWLLNGEPFVKRAVFYEGGEEALRSDRDSEQKAKLLQDLQLFFNAGINTLCLPKLHRQSSSFYEACEEKGFVIWAAGTEKEIDSRLLLREGRPSDLFYKCRAAWTEEPFVYISRESLKRQENGNYTITVYSNQKKTALYVDGILFEFQSGEREFIFREIPFHTLFLCLTAEAGECAMSVSLHRAFTKASF